MGVALIVASLAVLLAVGIHASRLGADPRWAFDCDDTTCEDLWVEARRRYHAVTAGELVAVAIGGALAGIPRPRRIAPVPARGGVGGTGAVVLAVWAIDVLAGASALLALRASVPLAMCVMAACCLLGTALLWRSLRRRGGRDRAAWFTAGLSTAAGLLGAALLTAALFPMLFVLAPLVGALALPTSHLLAVVTWSGGPAQDHGGEERATGGDREGRSEPWRPVVLASPALVGIAALAAWAGMPVPAPPADAWMHGGASTAPVDRDASDPAVQTGAGAVPAASEAVEPPTGQPVPPDLPACSPDQLAVRITGFDGVMGDGAARIEAENRSGRVCALRGRPELALDQGGEPLELRPEPLEAEGAAPGADAGAVLAPGQRAASQLLWPGYGDAADRVAPQSATVALAPGGAPLPAPFTGTTSEPGPAPFDLREDVAGGAEIRIGVWTVMPA